MYVYATFLETKEMSITDSSNEIKNKKKNADKRRKRWPCDTSSLTLRGEQKIHIQFWIESLNVLAGGNSKKGEDSINKFCFTKLLLSTPGTSTKVASHLCFDRIQDSSKSLMQRRKRWIRSGEFEVVLSLTSPE